MTEHLDGYPYSQDVITRLHGMAEVYRHFSQGKEVRTADLLDEAAGCISALLADLHAYRLTMARIADAHRPDADTSGTNDQSRDEQNPSASPKEVSQ